MDDLAKNVIKALILGTWRASGKLEHVKLTIKDDIILGERMAPGVYCNARINTSNSSHIEHSGGIHCEPTSESRYGHANEVATEIYSYFAARGVPVEITGEVFQI